MAPGGRITAYHLRQGGSNVEGAGLSAICDRWQVHGREQGRMEP
jgi:hypothetical protein